MAKQKIAAKTAKKQRAIKIQSMVDYRMLDDDTVVEARKQNGNPSGATLSPKNLRYVLGAIAHAMEDARQIASVAVGAVRNQSTDGSIEIAFALQQHVDNALHEAIERLSVAVHDVPELEIGGAA